MSFKLTQAAIDDHEADLSLAEWAVLVVLSRHADDAGANCYPSLETIARKAHAHIGTIRTALKGLEAKGRVSFTQAPGKCRQYTIAVDKFRDVVADGAEARGVRKTEGVCETVGVRKTEGVLIPEGVWDSVPNPCGIPYPTPMENRTQRNQEEVKEQTTLNISPASSDNFVLESPEAEKPQRAPRPKKAPRVLIKPDDCSQEVFDEWVGYKDSLGKAKCTQRMVDFIAREAEKAGISTEEAMLMAMEHGWRSFEAAYLRNQALPLRTSAPAQDIPPVIDYHRGINPDGTF